MKKKTIHNNSTRRKSKILLSLGAILTMLIMTSANVRAAAVWPGNVDTQSNAAIVMEAETGAILYEKNIDTQYYPASITKILTTLLALENCSLNEVVTYSHDAVYKNGGDSSHIGRDEGEQMTLEQCLYAVMLESCNESAYAVAEHVGGGDVNKFITMMNDKVKELGCTNTHFANPNGLPDPNHYTSARDMAIISKAAYENKIFDKITGTKTYTIPPTNKHAEPTLLNNHHAMLNFYQTNRYLYEPCVGGKTGYTQDAGATLVTYAKKDGMTLIAVVLNGETSTYYVDTTNILNYCFDNFTAYDLSSESGSQVDGRVGKLGSLNNDKKYIMRGENSTVILPRTADFSETTYKLVPSDDKGDVVGQVQYYYADRFVGSADLIFEKAKSVPYPFHNIDSEQGGSSVSYFRIDIKVIVIILIGLFITYLLLLFMRAKSGRILLKKKRKRDSKRKVEPRYTVIDRDRYRRRRRRRR